MKFRQLLLMIPLSMLAYSAFAANNSTTYKFSSTDPNVHEQFYCTVTNADNSDYVLGHNNAEMIKGFDHGYYLKTVQDFNTYYFDAYHDSNYNNLGSVFFSVMNKNANITCAQGQGGRTLIPGNYGKVQQK